MAEAGGEEPYPPYTRGTAICDFQGQYAHDLSFVSGEQMTLLEPCNVMYWYLAENKLGRRGVVPVNFLKVLDTTATSESTPQDSIKRESPPPPPLPPKPHAKAKTLPHSATLPSSGPYPSFFPPHSPAPPHASLGPRYTSSGPKNQPLHIGGPLLCASAPSISVPSPSLSPSPVHRPLASRPALRMPKSPSLPEGASTHQQPPSTPPTTRHQPPSTPPTTRHQPLRQDKTSCVAHTSPLMKFKNGDSRAPVPVPVAIPTPHLDTSIDRRPPAPLPDHAPSSSSSSSSPPLPKARSLGQIHRRPAKYPTLATYKDHSGWFAPTVESVLITKMQVTLARFQQLGAGIYFFQHKLQDHKKFVGCSSDLPHHLTRMFYRLYEREEEGLDPLELHLRYYNQDASEWNVRAWSIPSPERLYLEQAQMMLHFETLQPKGLNRALRFRSQEDWKSFACWYTRFREDGMDRKPISLRVKLSH